MFNRRSFLTAITAGLLLSSAEVRATTYFTLGSVRKKLFPTATRFVNRTKMLTKPQMRAIAKASKTRVKFSKVTAIDAYGASGKLGTLIIDRVYGKHEFITYAVALNRAGAVSAVEVMNYRESYGAEVRYARWLAQFKGKKSGQPLKIDRQIKNISGATLSCVHITNGVRRVLTTYAQVLA